MHWLEIPLQAKLGRVHVGVVEIVDLLEGEGREEMEPT